MRRYLVIMVLLTTVSCRSIREVEHRVMITTDTVYAMERVKVVDSIYKVADTIYHKTHEVVDRYIYKTSSNSDTIYVEQETNGEQVQKNDNTPWYIAITAVVITVLMLAYGIYRKK